MLPPPAPPAAAVAALAFEAAAADAASFAAAIAPADPDEPEWRCTFGLLFVWLRPGVGVARELHAREAHVDLLPRGRMNLLALLVVVFLLPAQPTKAAAVAATQGIMMAAAVGVAARRRASVRLCKQIARDCVGGRACACACELRAEREMLEGLVRLVEDIVESRPLCGHSSSTRASTLVSAAGTRTHSAARPWQHLCDHTHYDLEGINALIRQLCRHNLV